MNNQRIDSSEIKDPQGLYSQNNIISYEDYRGGQHTSPYQNQLPSTNNRRYQRNNKSLDYNRYERGSREISHDHSNQYQNYSLVDKYLPLVNRQHDSRNREVVSHKRNHSYDNATNQSRQVRHNSNQKNIQHNNDYQYKRPEWWG
jgi:hypothetical protein